MARVPVKFAGMHSNLFLAGKTFGDRLEPEKVTDLAIEYETDTDKLYVSYKGFVATVPSTSVMYWIEGEPKKRVDTNAVQTTGPIIVNRASAQVSGPTHHVFAGEGHGLTGQDGNKAKGKP